MPISYPRRALATAVLFASACTRPVPGVLTLVPAGMRISGTYVTHADGTLSMAAGATAESDAYIDAGTVSITVTAAASTSDGPMSIELWLAGTSLGSQRVQSTEPTAIPFHAQARAGGPVAIRLVALAAAPGIAAASARLEVQKIVVTEP